MIERQSASKGWSLPWLRLAKVRQLRRKADSARDARRWSEAAGLYEAVLALEPDNGPIQVQCAHMHKEAGAFEQAEALYLRALAAAPGDADLHLQIGHFHKVAGRFYEALGSYKRATMLDPGRAEPAEEIRNLRDRLVGPLHADQLLPSSSPSPSPSPRLRDEAAELPQPSLKPMQAGQHWLFLGDTSERLQAHDRLTGVGGKVTTELFFASLGETGPHRLQPCVVADIGSGLGSISLRDTAAYLARSAGTHAPASLAALLDASPAPPTTAVSPRPGDHVVFTGVVWTPAYEALFAKLARNRIRFSVLVYDIIPVLRPDYVSDAHAAMFLGWLRTVLTLADTVFVSGPHVRDTIQRWAVLSCVPVPARIVPIPFGFREPAPLQAPSARLARVRKTSFVLCVGTIDGRKNQAMLVRCWQRLTKSFGTGGVPQLVLVGRNDLGAEALQVGNADVVTLDGLDDAELAHLYRNCTLTLFPSLAEGYGLPVAESLHYGKLCIASDLAVIREHAGDLPWYFPPGDEQAAFALIHRALFNPELRTAAEGRIARDYRSPSWQETVTLIGEALARNQLRIRLPTLERRPSVPGLSQAPALETLARLAPWCTSREPLVSIIVINWNASAMTRECVRQIWANTAGITYEIIVADNGSEYKDRSVLSEMGDGTDVLMLGTNRFFGEANNVAAERARGRYLCFLNNDAFVHEGWLQALVKAVESPGAGAAGPLFLFPDGGIQEAGATMTADGIPVRHARGEDGDKAGHLKEVAVDYISAAALLLRRDVFMQVGGFDSTYEPAYYEDVDLCFKVRSLGLEIRFCPEARVTHVEGASTDDKAGSAFRKALGDVNREKFLARWGRFLGPDAKGDIRDARLLLPPAPIEGSGSRSVAILYTPYNLTAGGGERFLLSTGAMLARDYDMVLVTPYPYSRLRLASTLHELGIEPFACRVIDEDTFAGEGAPDVLVVLGNHIVPPIAARGGSNFFICQFPFPLAADVVRQDAAQLNGYDAILTYSNYAQAHVRAGLSAHQLPVVPVEVLYPPVPFGHGDPARKKRMVLSVGRFFEGGHSKRHDLMIDAFRTLWRGPGDDLELHLAGSSIPEQIPYIERIRAAAKGMPVFFHVNATRETLASLYSDAAIYWHAAGLGSNLAATPEQAEHFGITIVEAMSAGCAPVVFGAGGPREIVQDGVNGCIYGNEAELVEITRRLMSPAGHKERTRMAIAAAARAQAFSISAFDASLQAIIKRPSERLPLSE